MKYVDAQDIGTRIDNQPAARECPSNLISGRRMSCFPDTILGSRTAEEDRATALASGRREH